MDTGFWWVNLTREDHLEDLGLDGRIVLKRMLKKWDGGVHRSHLAQYRDRCWALVNAVKNLRAQ